MNHNFPFFSLIMEFIFYFCEIKCCGNTSPQMTSFINSKSYIYGRNKFCD